MYTAHITKTRIKELSKKKKINMETMLEDCNLGVNAIRQINDTKGMASFSLAKIADYLDCSVDYLLGRVDIPETTASDTYSDLTDEEKSMLLLTRKFSPDITPIVVALLSALESKPNISENLKEILQHVS